jgi:hypothetical protein
MDFKQLSLCSGPLHLSPKSKNTSILGFYSTHSINFFCRTLRSATDGMSCKKNILPQKSNFKFQFSTFSIHTSKFRHFNFQIFKFQTLHIEISNFNFYFSALSIHTSQLRHFSSQNFKFQTFYIQFSIFSF